MHGGRTGNDMRFIIRYEKLYLEGFEMILDRLQPVWSPTAAMRFDTREEAEQVRVDYPNNKTLAVAVIVPVAD